MRSGFSRNLFSSALQLLVNQALAFGLFLLLSRGLAKDDFGTLSWCLALLLLLFTLISGGIDQLMIRRMAAGEDERKLLPLYFVHLLAGGFLGCGLLFLFDALEDRHSGGWLLATLALGKWMLSLALPLKSWASGRERFGLLLNISLTAGIVKLLLISVLAVTQTLRPATAGLALAIADTAEFLFGLWWLRRHWSIRSLLRFSPAPYRELLRENGFQFGIVVFSTVVARIDQVLLGWVRPVGELAEYSFAVKLFELASLPLLAIAPLLLPRMSRQGGLSGDPGLLPLFRAELVLSFASLLLLNLCWTPVVDGLTGGRYGQVNEPVIFWLSLTLPLIYSNNFFWTALFAQSRLKFIFQTFGLAFAVNLVANVLLLPLLGGTGAALAFFLAQGAQLAGYLRQPGSAALAPALRTALVCGIIALGILALRHYLPANAWTWSLIGMAAFFVLLVLSGELGRKELRLLRHAIGR